MTDMGAAAAATARRRSGPERLLRHLGGRTYILTVAPSLLVDDTPTVAAAIDAAAAADCREVAVDLTGVEQADREAVRIVGQLAADLATCRQVDVAIAASVPAVRSVLSDVLDELFCPLCEDLPDALALVLRTRRSDS